MRKNQEIALYLIFIFFSTFWIFYTYSMRCLLFYAVDLFLLIGMSFVTVFICEDLEEVRGDDD